MKIKFRFFICITFLIVLALFFVFREFSKTLKPQFRKTTEETLIDTSRLLSKFATLSVQNNKLELSQFKEAFNELNSEEFEITVFDSLKTKSDLKLYITDHKGIVLFNSEKPLDVGKDYSDWRDVKLTLDGKYGARTSEDETGLSSMYVATPIIVDSKIFGVLTLIKPTIRVNSFVESAKVKILFICFIIGIISVLTFLLLSQAITKPIENLITYARAIRDGKRPALPNLGSSEIGELGQAFIEMKTALEGKNYIENYVQTLTHEIKAPISAIKGALEILEQDLSEKEKNKFLTNIVQQNQRIEDLVNNLLFLSKIENKLDLDKIESLEVYDIFLKITQDLITIANKKNIKFTFTGNKNTKIEGDRFYLEIVISNLLKNALEFSPENSEITTTIERKEDKVLLSIEDNGTGIPDYALDKIFNKFYSLPRPGINQKSTGLGLAFVKEILELHSATITLTNRPNSGTKVLISFKKKLLNS
jgi:two-component system sensor histidine kinase CreC